MRQAQHGRKIRGRGRKPNNPLSRTYDSVGPDTKVRGTASHIADRYVTLARDAQLSGDRVTSENYLQHAEHYIRIVGAAQEQAAASQQAAQAAQQPVQPQGNPQNGQRTPTRSAADEQGAAVNGQARDAGESPVIGEKSATGNENSNKRGGQRRQARPSLGDDSAISNQQPQIPAVPAPAPASTPRASDSDAVPHDTAPISEPVPVMDKKASDTLETAAPKPAPKRRRRTKPVEEVPALSDQAAPEPSGDPVS